MIQWIVKTLKDFLLWLINSAQSIDFTEGKSTQESIWFPPAVMICDQSRQSLCLVSMSVCVYASMSKYGKTFMCCWPIYITVNTVHAYATSADIYTLQLNCALPHDMLLLWKPTVTAYCTENTHLNPTIDLLHPRGEFTALGAMELPTQNLPPCQRTVRIKQTGC